MKKYSVRIEDGKFEEIFLSYCKTNHIIYRKHSHGFVDYDWYIVMLTSKQEKRMKQFFQQEGVHAPLLKRTIFNRKLADFFIDDKENK